MVSPSRPARARAALARNRSTWLGRYPGAPRSKLRVSTSAGVNGRPVEGTWAPRGGGGGGGRGGPGRGGDGGRREDPPVPAGRGPLRRRRRRHRRRWEEALIHARLRRPGRGPRRRLSHRWLGGGGGPRRRARLRSGKRPRAPRRRRHFWLAAGRRPSSPTHPSTGDGRPRRGNLGTGRGG